MDTFQIVWLVILTPIFFLYGLKELYSGWKILKYNEPSLNIAIQIRIWLIRLFRGDEEASHYERSFKNDYGKMRVRGFYSLLGGLASLIGSFVWIIVLYRTLR